jgi:hypothetical protein
MTPASRAACQIPVTECSPIRPMKPCTSQQKVSKLDAVNAGRSRDNSLTRESGRAGGIGGQPRPGSWNNHWIRGGRRSPCPRPPSRSARRRPHPISSPQDRDAETREIRIGARCASSSQSGPTATRPTARRMASGSGFHRSKQAPAQKTPTVSTSPKLLYNASVEWDKDRRVRDATGDQMSRGSPSGKGFGEQAAPPGFEVSSLREVCPVTLGSSLCSPRAAQQ